MAKSYLVGLVGEGIDHSLTPDLHMRETQHLGIDYQYRIIDTVEDSLSAKSIEWIVAEAAAAGYDALNVTHPFKQQVLKTVQASSNDVEKVQSANLVLNLQSKARAENTDWSGFEFALKSSLASDARDQVVQIGVGGAGSATAFALLSWGVQDLILADLSFERAQELSIRYQRIFPDQSVRATQLNEALALLDHIDGVVQATPIGMFIHPGMPFSIDNLNPSAWVADVIYRPIETELIATARQRGHRVIPGGLMAIGQAVDSLRLITGLEPNIERMTAHFYELLTDESVLTRAKGI